MPYQFSVWLDDRTARDLEFLSTHEERKRSNMVKVLIRNAACELYELQNGSHSANLQIKRSETCQDNQSSPSVSTKMSGSR